ncbi:MAG: ABC transporter, substrate-binding protein (cluster 5, nickel/peptides/opines) [uncultured Propionibacteriaceae bacterium]|uniref:ABC transporter, substrate-binding protein (Cluster 5, nickel/peptides/opines) n=1 Tax=uncultured Propionibacteriaceae bacterium TaxID=257457 RepID=A0A6J4P4S8_9ACTN|nr:MAG: ABC transporter, substrate-binding protein (cluster 5, nickel/peptides/opines) [uncultured Propionibacteriaceae bacterium]
MTEEIILSRRGLLQVIGLSAAGVAGLGGFVACAPAAPNDGSAGAAGGEFHGAWPYKQPPEGNFNNAAGPFGGVPYRILADGPYADLICLPSGFFVWADKTWDLMLAESYKLDSKANTFTVKIKPNLKWSDGSALTSKDYMTTFWCQWLQRTSLWNYVTKIEAPDDLTFTLTMNQPSTVVERYIMRSTIISTAVFGEWADKASALKESGKDMDSSEGGDLSSQFQKYNPKEYVANGPYNIDYGAISNTQINLAKNASGYGADKVKFDKLVIYNGETPEVTPLVQSKDVDYATHGFPTASEKSFQQAGFRIIRPPVYSGPAILFNLDKLEEFRDVRARQAIAHAIDRKANGTVSLGESGKGVQFMAGFSDNQVDQWLSATDKAKLNTYDFDQDKAAELLTDAGWKKDGANWTKPDGKPAVYEIQFPGPFADWSAAGTNAAEQLSEFGIKVTPRGLDDKQAPVDIDKGNFQLAIQAWGSSNHPHPHFAFVQDLFTHNIPVAKNQGGKGMGFELKTKTKAFGDVDLAEIVTKAGSGLNEAEQKANVTKAAIAFNELVPMVPLFERYGNNPALEGARVQAFPADDDPILKNAPYADNFVIMWIVSGKLAPAA